MAHDPVDKKLQQLLGMRKHFEVRAQQTRVVTGLARYTRLIGADLRSFEPATSQQYCRDFVTFYGMRRSRRTVKNAVFRALYEFRDERELNYATVLKSIFDTCELHRVEASFASKVLATINPTLPVYDSRVIGFLNSNPSFGVKIVRPVDPPGTRMQTAIEAYERICEFHRLAKQSQYHSAVIELFDESFRAPGFTVEKKLDILMWQSRPNSQSEHHG